MGKFANILNSIKNFVYNLKDKCNEGYKWLGTDGLINMQTSALLVMIFMIFFPVFWSAILTFILVIGKCTYDKSRGRENEHHDFICALLGILFGIIIASSHVVAVLI